MNPSDYSDLDDDIIIDAPPQKPARRGRLGLIVPVLFLVVIVLWRAMYLYVDSLWYGSLGFDSRFWYEVGLGWGLFAIFTLLTFAILRGGFYAIEKWFGTDKIVPKRIIVNKQPVDMNPSGYLRAGAWIASILFAILYGLAFSNDWNTWVLYFHQVPTAMVDPIFGRPVGFYLFTLPVYQLVTGWLMTMSMILLAASIVHAVVSTVMEQSAIDENPATPKRKLSPHSYAAISLPFGLLLLIIAVATLLSRYGYLWIDHAPFSGVTYTEANYLLPGLAIVAVSLVVAAAILVLNAFTRRSFRLILFALAIPAIVFVIAGMIVPGYVQSFIVKPNELGRETPYIEHNISWTRIGFQIDSLESRVYPADITPDALNLASNQNTLSNIRLWDWQALQDTLRQIQEIRTYYDFPDVDADRYRIGGVMRQVMIAARELDVNKLPEQSRNWINERLVYTHGYGVTINPVNEFSSEGRPRFLVSNMPVESTGDIRVTRPEIYFGERTDTFVYVNTKQPEFDYPQGENNSYTTYQGDGGFTVGSGLRRLSIAWVTGDISKLPFSDDVSSESRILLHRNISDRINRIAPFFTYDDDPYMMVDDAGRLIWIVDGYVTSDRFPYSRHYDHNGRQVNYIRNSVKVTIDAYTGAVTFYVFDDEDPIVAAYRSAFPELFKPGADMPSDVRAHVRYPELMMKTQSHVFGLYHTQSAKVFFGREDVWSIAQEAAPGGSSTAPQPLEPYQVLMPLPGEGLEPEFARVVPFTPGNRNNMIAWMAGRSDGDAYGKLLVYQFPASRVIDGPLQIEARIDQDAQIAGQITLWNQQGSKVKRGNLIIMPIGTGLLFVEPIYLQAVRSPMPELRLVVLATQERLTYAENFETALKQLLGEQAKAAGKETEAAKPGDTPPVPPSVDGLIKQASQAFADYQRLTAEGRLSEAGQKLDELKRILDQLQTQPK
jgi:uncharacterized membrane protein (UPF0182 family)